MRTIVLSILILVVVIQDAYGFPQRRGQRGESNRGIPRGENHRRGLGRPEHPHRGPPGRPGPPPHGPGMRGGRRHHSIPCMLMNVTANMALCNNSCPEYMNCTKLANDSTPQLDDSLELHICAFQTCVPESDTCLNGSTCEKHGSEFRCLPEKHYGKPPSEHQQEEEENEDSDCKDILKQILKEKPS